MVINDLIQKNKTEFGKMSRVLNVKSIFHFWSSVSGKCDISKSDIDLLVEIDITDPVERGDKLISLWDKLELFFNRKVDLLSNPVIRNPFLKQSIENSKVLIYGTAK